MIPRSSTEERPVERGDSCLSEHSLKQRIGARALNNSKDPKKGVWITAQKKIVYFQEYTIAVIIECIQSVKINTYTVFHNKRNIHPLFFCSFLCRCCFFFYFENVEPFGICIENNNKYLSLNGSTKWICVYVLNDDGLVKSTNGMSVGR